MLKTYFETVQKYCKLIVNSENYSDYKEYFTILNNFIHCLYNTNLINNEQRRYFQRKMWSARNSFKSYYFSSKEYKNSIYSYC